MSDGTLFHLSILVVGLLNMLVIALHVGRQEAAAVAPVDVWVLPALLAAGSLPSVFYLRRWAISAVNTRLWRRAPIIQFTGLLLSAAGMVAAVIQLAGLALVRLAHAGIGISLDPKPDRITVGTVYSDLLWQALDAAPVVNVTGTLGWERPVSDPNWPLGVGGIVVRVAVVIYLVATFVFLAPVFGSDLFPSLKGPRDTRRPRSSASRSSATPHITTNRVARATGRKTTPDRDDASPRSTT